MLVPLMLVAAAAVMTLEGRQTASGNAVGVARSLLAAEAAVDHALYLARTGDLTLDATIGVELLGGVSCTILAVDMLTDDEDNDADGSIDEADEAGTQVTVVGDYRFTRSSLIAYLGPPVTMPPIDATIYLRDPASVLDISGNSFMVTGHDTNLDGTPGPERPVLGVTMVAPGTAHQTLSGLSLTQQLNITGAGGTPSSRNTRTVFDLEALAELFRTRATTVLSGGHYSSLTDYGDAAADDWRIIHCAGDLRVAGNLSGAGILCVDGDLDFRGNVSFAGIVLVTGKVSFSGGGPARMIRGALLTDGGAGGDMLESRGGVDFQYSSQAIAAATRRLSQIVLLGWRLVAPRT
jgi:hypothetical protein